MKRYLSTTRAVAAVSLCLIGLAFLVVASVERGGKSSRQGDGLERKEARGDHPDEALRFRQLQLQDENGVIPVDGLQKARKQMDVMKAAQQAQASALGKDAEEMQVAGLTPASWAWLGPGNVGGRIRTVVIDPANANKMWVGSVGGGIWFTINAGGAWQSVNDFMANLAVSTMAIDPTNSAVMYAGTGESFAADISPTEGENVSNDGLRGNGIFKSTDGGVTWTLLAKTNSADATVCAVAGMNCPWNYVNRLAISPNGGTILAATNNGIQRSTDAGATWSAGGGIIGPLLDIDFDPSNPQNAVASGIAGSAYSVDGGQNWTLAPPFNPPITGRVELAYAPSSSNIVYASVNANNGDIYRSSNGGVNFTRVNTGTNFFIGTTPQSSNQGNYDNIIWVNPQDPTFIVVGGIDLWRSTDSGTTFNKISAWQSAPVSSAHADHHMIVASPGFNNTSNRTVFFTNDGGIYRADNVATVGPTTGWVNLNNTLGITQFYGAAANGAGTFIGGAQDNGNTRSTGNPNLWSDIPGMTGDGGFCAADPADANFLYGEYVNLQIRRSTNGGVSGAPIFAGISDANNGANFIAPFILDPGNSNTMLAGGLSLWRSTDVKAAVPTWTPIKSPATPAPVVPPANPNPTPGISAIAISSNNSDFIVVGHNDGQIFLTFNGTGAPTWSPINNGTPTRFVTRLTIDNTRSPNWIYATFGGFAGNNVYVTKDLGTTWTDVSGVAGSATDLPNVPVRSLVINSVRPDLLYVGTEVGVFASEDAGATWQLPTGGPANVSVDELFWYNGDLIAVTHGRGLYRTSTPVYNLPVCIAPPNCPCFGLWSCACTWNNNQVPTGTSDIAVYCPVTTTGGAVARNLRVDGLLTLKGNLTIVEDLANFGSISSPPGFANVNLTVRNLSNSRPPNVVTQAGIISLSGTLQASGTVTNGGIIGFAGNMACNDLTTSAMSTLSMNTLTVKGNTDNAGYIEGSTLDLSSTTGPTQTLSGAGTWKFAGSSIGQGRTVALLSNVTLDIAAFSNQFGTLNLGSKTLTFRGSSFTNNNGTVTGTGKVVLSPATGTASFGTSGPNLFSAGVTIATGTVSVGGGTLNGPFLVNAGAIATMPSTNLTIANDVTVNGVLKGLSPAATGVLRFNGTTFTNNGAVGPDLSFITFNSNLAPLSQVIVGPGSWGAGVLALQGSAPAKITLMNDATFAVDELQVTNLDIGNHILTFLGSKLFGGAIKGSGLFIVQPTGGTSSLTGSSALTIAPSVKIGYGVVKAFQMSVGGNLEIDPSATLSVVAGGSPLNVAGNLTNNGVLNAFSGSPTLNFQGSTFINNGMVSSGLNTNFIPTVPPTQSLAGNGTWTGTSSLYIDGSSVTNLLSDVTYDGANVFVQGRLNTGAFTLTLPCTTTWSGTGDAVGSLRRTNLAACPGGAIAYGNPFTTVTFNSGTPPTALTVKLDLSAPSGFVNAIRRTYTITPTGGSGYAATLRLHYLDAELNGNNEATLALLRRDGAAWNLQGASNRNTTNNWVEYANVTQFSPWTLASVGAPPLPNTFAKWQQGFFTPQELLDPAISGDFADPDHDGLSNLLEYALHLDPKDPSVAGAPFSSRDATYFSLTYTRPIDVIDLTYAIEETPDMVLWSPVIPVSVILAADGVTQTVKAQVSINGAPNMFLRLRVSR